MKKRVSILLACMMFATLSLTACGGGDEEVEEEVVEEVETEAAEEEEEEEEEVEEAEGEAVSEDTWAELMEVSATFGQYNKAAEALGEDVPEELVAYAQEINERAKEVAGMTLDNTTEEDALAAIDDINSWIEEFSQYVEPVEAEAAPEAEAGEAESADPDGPVTDVTWEAIVAASNMFGQYNKAAEALGEDCPAELVEYAESINEDVKAVASLTRENLTEGEANEIGEQIGEWIVMFSSYVTIE